MLWKIQQFHHKNKKYVAQYFYFGLLLMIVLFFQFKSGIKVRTNLILIPESDS